MLVFAEPPMDRSGPKSVEQFYEQSSSDEDEAKQRPADQEHPNPNAQACELWKEPKSRVR
jgi:hypothetical protein